MAKAKKAAKAKKPATKKKKSSDELDNEENPKQAWEREDNDGIELAEDESEEDDD